MALLMQDFGSFHGLNIWVELEDDSLQINDQPRLFVFVKNESRKFAAQQIEIKISIKPDGPTIFPNPVIIKKLVPGRTKMQVLPVNIGNSKKGVYSIEMSVDFQFVPGTWQLDSLEFQVQ